MVKKIKKLTQSLPLAFWASFYIFIILITLPLLAYIGTYGRADVPYQTGAFVTSWEITGIGNNQITIPTHPGEVGNYNYNVDWGDGNVSSNRTGDASHTYSSGGTYTVQITGSFPAIYFDGSDDSNAYKIISIDQWGSNQWARMDGAFAGAGLLTVTATDSPDLSHVSSMKEMFKFALSFNSDINNWNVSNVTDMSGLFWQASAFNQPLDNWDVGSVTDMSWMFAGTYFNQPLDNWDVGNVTDMNWMFGYSGTFNQPLDNWDVGSVTNMSNMFIGSPAFDQSLGNWNVSNVTDMSGMFYNGSGLSIANYDSTLSSWVQASLQNSVTFDAGTSQFCTAAQQRQSIINTYGWTINDEGRASGCPDESQGGGASDQDNTPTDSDNNSPSIDGSPTASTPPTQGIGQNTPKKPKKNTNGSPSATNATLPDDTQQSLQSPGSQTDPNVPLATLSRPIAGRPKENLGSPLDLIRNISVTVFRTTIYSLLLLLFAVAIFYSYLAYLESRRRKVIIELVTRFRSSQAARSVYLDITSHYINSPIAIMQGALQLLESQGKIQKELADSTTELLESLSNHSEQLLSNTQDLTNQQTRVVQQISTLTLPSMLTSPLVWLPAVSVTLLVALANFLFLRSDKYSPDIIAWFAQFGIYLIGVITLTTTALYYRKLSVARKIAESEVKLEKKNFEQQTSFIASVSDYLSTDLDGLASVASQFSSIQAGYKQLASTVVKLRHLYDLTKNVPGIVWRADVTSCANTTVLGLSDRADQRNITISSYVKPNLFANIEESALVHLISAPIENAIKYSPAGQSVVFNVIEKKSHIVLETSDKGRGIEKRLVEQLTQPFMRASTQTYDYEGMGLDLYIARVILEHYGGAIKIQSIVGQGTTVTIFLAQI